MYIKKFNENFWDRAKSTIKGENKLSSTEMGLIEKRIKTSDVIILKQRSERHDDIISNKIIEKYPILADIMYDEKVKAVITPRIMVTDNTSYGTEVAISINFDYKRKDFQARELSTKKSELKLYSLRKCLKPDIPIFLSIVTYSLGAEPEVTTIQISNGEYSKIKDIMISEEKKLGFSFNREQDNMKKQNRKDLF